jgi:phosphoglycolate phosphatase
MLTKLVELSGIDQSVLESEIRVIHQRTGTSEYSHLIQEIPSLVAKDPGVDLAEKYGEAIHAYRIARQQAIRLYPGVLETLTSIRTKGTTVVAYTESFAFYTAYRIRKLGLDGVIDYLYSPSDHDFPTGITKQQLRTLPSAEYELAATIHDYTPSGVLKPDPEVLSGIVEKLAPDRQLVAYVGDSLMKDVAMAQAAGVQDVHAKYGEVQERPEYELLRRVSHWPTEDVEQERKIVETPDIFPSFVLKHSFSELLDLFEFSGP